MKNKLCYVQPIETRHAQCHKIQSCWAQHGGSAQIYNNLPEEEGEFK